MTDTLTTLSIALQPTPVAAQVQALNQRYLSLWWQCAAGALPPIDRYAPSQQQANEQKLARLLDQLIAALKRTPPDEDARQALQEQLLDTGFAFAQTALGFEKQPLDLIRSYGFIEVMQQFGRMAREFDDQISWEDVYQAGRNVMSMNFMQALLGLPVQMTPAIFAYSMLYPYTDNYLDDPAIGAETKKAFNQRFARQLQGQWVSPENAAEERIYQLVAMIEDQYPRPAYPRLHQSLLAIHQAQARSLGLVQPEASPYEIDVLGITFEKGGASVLADGYLVAGELSDDQADFMFGYGAFTQLMDDLEDIEADRKAGRLSLFSQTADHWPLDALTTRTLHFGLQVLDRMDGITVPEAMPLKAFFLKSVAPLIFASAGQAGRYYTPAYLRQIEAYMPFRFAALKKQRRKLARQQGLSEKIFQIWITPA